MAVTPPAFRGAGSPTPGVTPATSGVTRRQLVRWGLVYLYVTALVLAVILVLVTAGAATVDWLSSPDADRTGVALLARIADAVRNVNSDSNTFAMMLMGGLPAVAFATLPGYLMAKTKAANGVAGAAGSGAAGTEDDMDFGDDRGIGPELNPYGNLTPEGLVGVQTDIFSDDSHLT